MKRVNILLGQTDNKPASFNGPSHLRLEKQIIDMEGRFRAVNRKLGNDKSEKNEKSGKDKGKRMRKVRN